MAELPADEPERIRALTAHLGLPGIIDVHSHFMPQRMLDKVWAYFDRIEPRTGVAWPIAYRLPQEERLARLRSFGVRAFTSLSYPHKPGMAQWLNAWSADFADAHADCLRSATFYPEEGAGAYVRKAVEAGTQVFKAHVQVGDYDPHDPLLDEVWGCLQESRTPVVIHAGHGPERGRFTGPEGMASL
ncbi:MAG: amidohydrolase family protein, partial [Nocardioides sp.]|nr:amidohydrolase family protein [Nocardioides sp.]